MQSFKWMESFNTGNAVIDGQHQELMECMNELATYAGEGKGKKVRYTCQKLRQLVSAHFTEEEGILRDAGYPGLDDHLDSHQETSRQFNQICTTCSEVCRDNRAGPCIMDMTSILLFHFLHGDMDFKSFLQTKGLADNGH